MAKKKSEPKSEASDASTKSAKKAPAPAKKPAAKPAANVGSPLIDTSHVAESAARMLSARVNLKNAGGGSKHAESSMFKQLKSGLNKPTGGAAMNNLLDKTHGPSNIPKQGGNFNQGGKQVGHNQTFGADVTKSGVPRRTSGG